MKNPRSAIAYLQRPLKESGYYRLNISFFPPSVLLRWGEKIILFNVSTLERNILIINQMIKPDNWHHAGHLPRE